MVLIIPQSLDRYIVANDPASDTAGIKHSIITETSIGKY